MSIFKRALVGTAIIAVLAAQALPVKPDKLTNVSSAMIVMFIGSAATPAFAYIATYDDATTQTTYTYTTVNTGTAHSSRVTHVGITYNGSNAVSSVTINGVTGVFDVASGSASRGAELWHAANPTGTTNITVTVVCAASNSGCKIAVWAGYPSSATPVDALGNNGNSASTSVVDLAKTAGGYAIFIAKGNATGIALDISTAGTEGAPTEHFESNFDAAATIAAYSFLVTATSSTTDYTLNVSPASGHGWAGATWA